MSRKLNQDPEKCYDYYRMNSEIFKIHNLNILKTNIRKKDTNFRQAVNVEERLADVMSYKQECCSICYTNKTFRSCS